ncbi:hypothetical protein GCM10023238_04510 [Streptomyces heliomycini]
MRAVQTRGARPSPPPRGYALPFPVPDAAAAVRLAAELEDRVGAGVYADLVRASGGEQRRGGRRGDAEAAVRSVPLERRERSLPWARRAGGTASGPRRRTA